MTRTLIDIDDELLEQARAFLGTKTKKDTVHEALREVIRKKLLQEEIDFARNGGYSALLEIDPRNTAWRSPPF